MKKIIIVDKIDRSKRPLGKEEFTGKLLNLYAGFYRTQLSEAIKRGIQAKKMRCGLSTMSVKQSKV